MCVGIFLEEFYEVFCAFSYEWVDLPCIVVWLYADENDLWYVWFEVGDDEGEGDTVGGDVHDSYFFFGDDSGFSRG